MKTITSTILLLVIVVGGFFIYQSTFNKVQLSKAEEVDAANIKQIKVKSSSADVKVTRYDGDDIMILLSGNVNKKVEKKFPLQIQQHDSILNISFEMEENVVGFVIGDVQGATLEVKVPIKIFDLLELTTSSGNITASDLTATNTKVESSSGDIQFDGLEGDLLAINNTSGNQKVSNSKTSQVLTLRSSSGNLEINDVITSSTDIKTSSGNIIVKESQSEEMKLRSSSGDITYDKTKLAGNIDCKTESGEVKVKVEEAPTSLKVDFVGDSGEAKIQLKDVLYEDKTDHSLIGVKGDEEFLIKVRTGSGDFRLQ